MRQSNYLGIILCLLAAILWGGMFPVMSTALHLIDPFTFTSVRYLIAGILCALIAIIIEGKSIFEIRGQRVGFAWLIGTIGFAGFNFLIFLGQKIAGRDGTLIASVFIAIQPILGVFVNWVINRKKPSIYSFVFMIISFIGVILVISKGDLSSIIKNPNNYIADILMLIASLSWVIYTNGVVFFPTWSTYKYTTITCILGVLSVIIINFLLIVFGIIPVTPVSNLQSATPQILYMSIPAGVIAVLFWIAGNKILSPVNG